MNIKETSKSIGSQISIFVLIAASIIVYAKDDIALLYQEVQSAKLKEIEYTKKVITMKKQSENERFFEKLLTEYLNDSSHINLGVKNTCDKTYMNEYRKADAALAALEGAAKTAGIYDHYTGFFKNQDSISMTLMMNCDDKT